MMRFWLGVIVLYSLALLQGIVFVTVPAASNFLMSEVGFGFSASQYGLLFFPMIIGAVIASIFGMRLGTRWGLKRLALTSFSMTFASMALMTSSHGVQGQAGLSLALFLFLMLLLGSGFGLGISILNVYVMQFFPKRASTAIICLHSLLGIGTALSPKVFSFFSSIQWWWGAPLFLSIFYLLLSCIFIMAISREVGCHLQPPSKKKKGSVKRSRLLFITFGLSLFFYGVCETAFGNWGPVYLHQQRGLPVSEANNALALFWACVTAGRLLAAFLSLAIKPEKIFLALPFLLIFAFCGVSLFAKEVSTSLLLFSFAGLSCSAFFPLGVSLSTSHFSKSAERVSGVMVGLYLTGYGVTAEGFGLLHGALNFSYSSLFIGMSMAAVLMCFLNIYIVKKLHSSL